MTLVAGVDSSTQASKVVICDAATGAVVRRGTAAHPDGTEVDPAAWELAGRQAIEQAGGLDDVAALSIGAQQHGMVCLDDQGRVVRPALLWNDTRSAAAARDLTAELGGPAAWAVAVGTVPVASLTVTKLRWLADAEPAMADRAAAVCLPHDWLTWRLAGQGAIGDLVTDRSDASGTGYWSPAGGRYRQDILKLAFGRELTVPAVQAGGEVVGELATGVLLGAGAGDNAAAMLGLGGSVGEALLSIGTSGVVAARSSAPTADPSGMVAGFASATGDFLPLACTLNAARVLDAACQMLGFSHDRLSELALGAPAGAEGLTLIPYLEGERTPNRPDATGSLHGLRPGNATAANLARAAVEGLLCGLADGLDALAAAGVAVDRVLLVGGGSRSHAVRAIAPSILGRPVLVPPADEYVALGAARQAAWVLAGGPEPPLWPRRGVETYEADPAWGVRERYAEVRDSSGG